MTSESKCSDLGRASVIFWDFDGVIKDSVEVKTAAYVRLFFRHGEVFAGRVKTHHEENGGMSRFEKIPLYLSWLGEEYSPETIREYCDLFSQQVLKAVVQSPWVPGVREYLLDNFLKQYFVLVTATPQDEIETILRELEITKCFKECYGAPKKKGTNDCWCSSTARLSARQHVHGR